MSTQNKKEIIKKLKEMKNEKLINQQQYKTYKGQILSGNMEAALVGMRRKGLIINGC